MRDMNISTLVEAVFASTASAPQDDAETQARNARIRHLRAEGYQFRRQLLYHNKDGSLAGYRIGVFDSTGPALVLIEERVYRPDGVRQDSLLDTAVGADGRAPACI